MQTWQWNEKYSVDSGVIDNQHKMLLKLAAELLVAVRQHYPEEKLYQTYRALLNYTQKHFHEEEEYFDEVGVEMLDAHRCIHDQLASELKNMWQREQDAPKDEKGEALLRWVRGRLIPHMIVEDQKAYQSIKTHKKKHLFGHKKITNRISGIGLGRGHLKFLIQGAKAKFKRSKTK